MRNSQQEQRSGAERGQIPLPRIHFIIFVLSLNSVSYIAYSRIPLWLMAHMTVYYYKTENITHKLDVDRVLVLTLSSCRWRILGYDTQGLGAAHDSLALLMGMRGQRPWRRNWRTGGERGRRTESVMQSHAQSQPHKSNLTVDRASGGGRYLIYRPPLDVDTPPSRRVRAVPRALGSPCACRWPPEALASPPDGRGRRGEGLPRPLQALVSPRCRRPCVAAW